MKKRFSLCFILAIIIHIALFSQVSTMRTVNGCTDLFGFSGEGDYGAGAIYMTDGNQSMNEFKSLFAVNGYKPYGELCKSSNGKLYGMTSKGGKYDYGVFFEWDPHTGIYTVKFDFDGKNGNYPNGSLIEADNGKIYGMTLDGGLYGFGVLFEWDPDSELFSVKIHFEGATNGSSPFGSLVQANNGLIYGMTSAGGANDDGVLFEWNPVSNAFINKFDFNGDENGSNPRGSLIITDSGKFYGLTVSGGVNGLGVLFEWDPSTDSFCKKVDFNQSGNGSYPHGSLFLADNKKLYGMTSGGGLYDMGTLFEFDPVNNILLKKIDFDGAEKGKIPLGSLAEAENGRLIGITSEGGSQGGGVLFEYDFSTDIYYKKHELDFKNGGKSHGALVRADNGKYYGMTRVGGVAYLWYTSGVLYEWDPITDTFSLKLKFNDAGEGADPVNMVEGYKGKFYGTTHSGGEANLGVIFEFDPSGNSYKKKFDFTGGENGLFPSRFIKGKNGRMYGVTGGAGVDYADIWTIIEWDPVTSQLNRLFYYDENLDETQKGKNPRGNLIQAENGNIYGTTSEGGQDGHGIIFELDPVTRIFTKKLDFDNQLNGMIPDLLTEAKNGKFYGIARSSAYGDNHGGFLFEWDPAGNSFVNKLDFTDSIYVTSLFQLENNKFYGAANLQSRTIFYEWDAETNIYLVKLEMDNYDASINPFGTNLTQGEKGILYGTIQDETDYYIFEWEPLNNNFERIFKVNVPDGKKLHGLVARRNQSSDTLNAFSCSDYLSPSGNFRWTKSGTYKDTIPNINGCDSIITVVLTIDSLDVSVIQHEEILSANAIDATYQWIDCNSNLPVEGETNQTFNPAISGNYAVIVSKNECADTSGCFEVSVTGSTVNIPGNSISVFPNPNEGSFTIDLGSAVRNAEITITELDGRIIQKEQFYNCRNMDIKMNTSPGIYMVIINSESKSAAFKILKK